MFQQEFQQQKRQVDISGLQDFQIKVKQDWTDWQFKQEQYDNIPLGFNNKFNFYRNFKYCDLQQAPQDSQFMQVYDVVKKKNKDFISKNDKMSQIVQAKGFYNMNRRNQKRRVYAPMQIKTNFKKITVKNNWLQLQSIKKNNIDQAPTEKAPKIQVLKTIGSLNEIDPGLDRISWQQIRFKQNTVYEVNTVQTANDQFLRQIAQSFMDQQNQDNGRVNVICHPNFLLALLTARASAYPWNIQIQKIGNIIVLQNFKQNKQSEQKQLTYLDLFTPNQNTSNSMPSQQSKVKQNCINATRMTQVFKDLLASGDKIEKQELSDLFPSDDVKEDKQQQQQQGQDQQDGQEENEEPKLQKIRKYIKIPLGNIDIYTFVEIDGAKRINQNDLEYSLIRIFIQTQSLGKWQRDMKSPGALITKQLTSNSCSIHKWICQAKLAGVQSIRIGYIGIGQTVDQKKIPILLNVSNNSVKSLQTNLLFKQQSCWGSAKYILNLLVGLQNGFYVLAKNPYSPLSIKLYHTSTIQLDQQQQDQNQQVEQEQAPQQTK